LKNRSARAAPAGSDSKRPSLRLGGVRAAGDVAKKGRRQFAGNRIMLKAIRTGFTFRFREW